MKRLSILFTLLLISILSLSAQNVGIGTNSPIASFQVATNRTVLFGQDTTGSGTRMMWIPSKHAFRVGTVGPLPNFDGDSFYEYADPLVWNYDSIGHFSFSSGFSNLSLGNGSSSLGAYNRVTGEFATAIGVANRAFGYGSFCSGLVNEASALSSTACGEYSIAKGDYSFAVGAYAQAIGQASIAMGYSTVARGAYSLVSGQFNEAIGAGSTAMGSYNQAIGNNSFVGGGGPNFVHGNSSFIFGINSISRKNLTTSFGNNCIANATLSTTIGNSCKATAYNVMITGAFNDTIGGSDPDHWVAADPLFILGNGTDDLHRKNALIVLKNGKTGLGTNTPNGLLHVKYNSNIGSPQLFLEESGNDYGRITIKNANPGFWDMAAYCQPIFGSNTDARYSFYFSQLGANVLTLKGDGNASLNGVLTQYSDERLKTHIAPLTNVLERITQLTGYTYQWKDERRGQNPQIGLIAQEVEQQFPELVDTDADGMKSVAYSNMVPVLLEAIKAQQLQIDELRSLLQQK